MSNVTINSIQIKNIHLTYLLLVLTRNSLKLNFNVLSQYKIISIYKTKKI